MLLCAASRQSRLALPTKSPLQSHQPLGVSDVATSALPHGEFCLRRRSLRNFLRTLRNRWGGKDLRVFWFFLLRASEKPEHAQGGKRAESSPLQEQQLIW